jgi:LysM repeat protein
MIERTLKVINRLKVFPILLALTLIALLNSVAFAAPPLQTGDQQAGVQQGKLQATGGCAQQYTVQAGDSLSTIANKFFGDLQSYTLIVDATNEADVNNGFATIDDPNVIQVGQTLCIPAQAGQQVSTQQQGQLQQSAQQGTIANQNLLSVPEGMSKIVFQNLSTRDLIVDVTNGPSPQSVWVNPGTQHEFVVQPGQYTVMGHQPGVELAITPTQLQLQPGQLVGVTCQDASQCQLFSTSQELALLDEGTVPLNPNSLLSPVPQVEDDENDDKDDSPNTHNNDDNAGNS